MSLCQFDISNPIITAFHFCCFYFIVFPLSTLYLCFNGNYFGNFTLIYLAVGVGGSISATSTCQIYRNYQIYSRFLRDFSGFLQFCSKFGRFLRIFPDFSGFYCICYIWSDLIINRRLISLTLPPFLLSSSLALT